MSRKPGALNLRVRAKNPVFWVQVALAVATPVAAYFGITPQSLTSWPAIGQVLLDAVQNPYVLMMAAVSVWNALNDPTTRGVLDSDTALAHDKPA